MTNIDRTADIIERATRGAHTTEGRLMKMSDHTAQVIAEALADDGLLAPELPEPDGCDADGLPYWGEGDYNTALTWHPCDRDIPRNERPLLIHSPISPWMHPDELEAEALRALAAARAARRLCPVHGHPRREEGRPVTPDEARRYVTTEEEA